MAIGGSGAGEGNVISGNDVNGIETALDRRRHDDPRQPHRPRPGRDDRDAQHRRDHARRGRPRTRRSAGRRRPRATSSPATTATGGSTSGKTAGRSIEGNTIGLGTDGVREAEQPRRTGGSAAGDLTRIGGTSAGCGQRRRGQLDLRDRPRPGQRRTRRSRGTSSASPATAARRWAERHRHPARQVGERRRSAAPPRPRATSSPATARPGITIAGGVSEAPVIEGNYIGTDATGTLDRGNLQHGVTVGSANDARIGGDDCLRAQRDLRQPVLGRRDPGPVRGRDHRRGQLHRDGGERDVGARQRGSSGVALNGVGGEPGGHRRGQHGRLQRHESGVRVVGGGGRAAPSRPTASTTTSRSVSTSVRTASPATTPATSTPAHRTGCRTSRSSRAPRRR